MSQQAGFAMIVNAFKKVIRQGWFKLIERSARQRRRRSPWFWGLLLLIWCFTLGSGIGLVLNPSSSVAQSPDDVLPRYQSGAKLYLETCSDCHLPIPPQVLPTETWQRLLEKPEDHYGTSVPGLIRLTQVLMWEYVRTYSRPLTQNEPMPFYVERSRYFKALHPRVELPDVVSHQTCITCHPNAKRLDYQTLAPAWQDAP